MPFSVAQLAQVFDGSHLGHHQREWFADPTFTPTQLGYHLVIRRIARQVKSANALHGNNLAIRQPLSRFLNRLSCGI